MAVTSLHRTLEQELLALLRGASLECPACGEFVLHRGASVCCGECDLVLHGKLETDVFRVESGSQAG